MPTTTRSSRKASQRLIGGDTLFIGGMVLAFAVLCPGFGAIGLTIGLSLIVIGGWFCLLARPGAHEPVCEPARVITHGITSLKG